VFEVFTALADWATYDVARLTPGGAAADALHFFIEDTTKILTLLVVVVFVMGLFRSALDGDRIRRAIEHCPGALAHLAASALGAVTPFCSCSSVPLFIAFLKSGIPLGVTTAFLITSPLVNEMAVVMLASLLGWKMTVAYVAVGMGLGVVGGLLVDRTRPERWVEDHVWKIRVGAAPDLPVDTSMRGRVRFAWGETREIFGRIWLYVLAGIAVGAVLHGWVPADWLARWVGSENPFGVPLAVLFGLPLYSNATGIIPVAEALLGKGVPIGTAIAFMMSVVAISPPEFIILRQVLRARTLVVLAGYLTVALIGVGYLLNASSS